MVFIRAPIIERTGPNVKTLASYEGKPVLVRQGPILVATFHPELTSDTRVHNYFLQMVKEAQAKTPSVNSSAAAATPPAAASERS